MTDTATLTTAPDVIVTTHSAVEDEIFAAWVDGYIAAERDMAERVADLDATWREVGRTGREQRVARDIADMERRAAAFHAKHGTHEWAGVSR